MEKVLHSFIEERQIMLSLIAVSAISNRSFFFYCMGTLCSSLFSVEIIENLKSIEKKLSNHITLRSFFDEQKDMRFT